MKILEWSIYDESASASKPPAGLECVNGCNPLLVLYVQSPGLASATLLEVGHPDVRSSSTVRNRTVGVLVARLLTADFLNPDWRLRIQYDETAVLSRELLAQEICQVRCMTCEQQGLSHSQPSEAVPIQEKLLARVPRGEPISGARAVFLADDGGLMKAYRASAASGESAHGFVKEAGGAGEQVDVWHFCDLAGLSGISKGESYFLGNAGELVTGPPAGAVVIQRLGLGISNSSIFAFFNEPTFRV